MYVDLKTPTTYWLVSGIGHTANPEMKNRRAAEIQFSVSGEWLKTVFSHFKQRNKPVSIDIDANIYVNMYCLGESEKKTGNAKVKTKFIFSE